MRVGVEETAPEYPCETYDGRCRDCLNALEGQCAFSLRHRKCVEVEGEDEDDVFFEGLFSGLPTQTFSPKRKNKHVSGRGQRLLERSEPWRSFSQTEGVVLKEQLISDGNLCPAQVEWWVTFFFGLTIAAGAPAITFVCLVLLWTALLGVPV